MHTSVLGDLGHVSQIHKVLLSASILPGDQVVDATLGNGYDALSLMALIGGEGFLYGFDIQEEAIDAANERLAKAGYENYTLILDSHSRMETYLAHKRLRGFVFNLGYLPKGEKSLTTLWETTEQALIQAMDLVMEEGFISVMTYPGHETGHEEDLKLNEWLSGLSQKAFQVSKMEFLNQMNHPPKLYWITKRRSGKLKEKL